MPAAAESGRAAASSPWALDEAGGEWPPDERAQYAETLAALRAAASADVERWRELGRAMTAEDAGAYALRGSAER